MLRISEIERSELELKALTRDEAKKVIGGSLVLTDENNKVVGYTCTIVFGKTLCPDLLIGSMSPFPKQVRSQYSSVKEESRF